MSTQQNRSTVASPLDPETLRRAVNGDEQAFTRLVVVHERALRRVVRSLLPRDRVDDVMQDVLLKIHRQLHRFDLERADRLRPWLLVLARNVCLDELRRPKRPNVPLDELEFDLECDEQAPLDVILHDEHEQLVLQHLARLPAWYRDAFRQRCLEGQSYEDIARQENITRAAARTRVGRARNRLQLCLEALHQVA